MGSIEIVSTGPEPLQNDQCKAILVLRLGAALNSIRAAQRWTIKNQDEGPAGEFDRFQAYLVAAAHLAEACKLFWANQGCILELARKGDVEENKASKLVSIADPKTGVQANLLKWIRDKETFHWDSNVFEGWASAQKGKVVWCRSSGETAGECVMSASYEALVDFTVGLGVDKNESETERINDQLRQVLEAMKHVIHVFESAVAGFVQQHDALHEVEAGDDSTRGR